MTVRPRLILVLDVYATSYPIHSFSCAFSLVSGGRRGRDSMVVGFITTHETSAYHHYRFEFEPRSGEVYSIQHYVIKLVSDLRQVDGLFWVLRSPPSII